MRMENSLCNAYSLSFLYVYFVSVPNNRIHHNHILKLCNSINTCLQNLKDKIEFASMLNLQTSSG